MLAAGCPASRKTSAERRPEPVAGPTTAATAASPEAARAAAEAPVPRYCDSWLGERLCALDPRFADLLAHAEELRLELFVTLVEPERDGGHRFSSHGLRADAEYVYPASAVKLMLAVSFLRRLAVLGQKHGGVIDRRTRLRRCHPRRPGCKPPRADVERDEHGDVPEQEDEQRHADLYLGTELRKMLSYSDNDSFNRLFDIVGHRELNEDMARLGLRSVRFHHEMNLSAETSRRTLRVELLPRGGLALTVPSRLSDLVLAPTPATGLKVGRAYQGEHGFVAEPLDFGNKNYASLGDLQWLLRSLVFPASPGAIELGLDAAGRELIVDAMSGPLAPLGDSAVHKPMLPGVLRVLDARRTRYVSKSGRALGFHLENAYIEDRASGRGMLVAAAIYANPDGVLNDDDYAYDTLSVPFFSSLGWALARIAFAP
jgi:hypothetical protein